MAIGSRFALWKRRYVSDDYWHAGGGSCKTPDNLPWKRFSIFKLLDRTPADANVMGNSTSNSAGVSSDEEFEFIGP